MIRMDEHERQLYLDELALDPDYYDREEVLASYE